MGVRNEDVLLEWQTFKNQLIFEVHAAFNLGKFMVIGGGVVTIRWEVNMYLREGNKLAAHVLSSLIIQ